MAQARPRMVRGGGGITMNLLETIRQRHALASDAPVGISFNPLTEVRVKAAERDQPILLTAVATTPRPDMDGEVVVAEGLDPATFQKLGSIYYNHDYNALPVAALRSIVAIKGGGGWRVQMSMARNQFAQDVATAIEDGAIRGTSIGFRRIDWGEPSAAEVQRYGPHAVITRKGEWIELSITPMPCNQDALIDRSRSAITDATADALDSLAVKGRIARESAYAMGLPKPRVMLQVKRVLDIGGVA